MPTRPHAGKQHAALLAAVAIATLPAFSYGATVSYTGPNPGSWNTTSNWSGSAVPANGDDVSIGAFSPTRSGVIITVTYNASNLSGTGLNSLTLDSVNCQLEDLLLN